jgi:hypothetical protein
MKDDPTKPYKAIYAAVIAFLGTLGTAFTDGGVSSQEWIAIVLATVLAGGGTYGLANPQVPDTDGPVQP